jgi:hypothetical protein
MLIKVEAINIDFFVNDTHNLSTIRGGSLLLLEMPEKFGAWLSRHYGGATKIRSGASQAIFELGPRAEPAAVESAAKTWLKEQYPHATIGVAVIPQPPQNYFAAFEELTLLIRAQQMRSFTFGGFERTEAPQVCAWDRLRPAEFAIYPQGERVWLSAATKVRYDEGRDAKRHLLHERAGLPDELEYTQDLDQLSGFPAYGNLNHKIAILYADGNSFAKLLKTALSKSDADRQKTVIGKFDSYIQCMQREFVKTLLTAAAATRWQTPAGARRIEILLWGGDEMMLVVPAWCGWETAEIFCRTMKNQRFRDGQVDVPMKHALGLVFAHHNAPIHSLTNLARALVDEAKGDREQTRLSYLVLESFDHVGEELARFRALRCPDPNTRKALVLSAECDARDALKEIREALHQLKLDEFPRRKVFQAALGLAAGKPWADLKPDLDACLNDERWKKNIAQLTKLVGGEQPVWYHLADLWDFVGLEGEG